MKTKKKLLLMGVGAMSALAIGVGATSTFAWFSATQALTGKLDQASASGISVADAEVAVSKELQYLLTATASSVSAVNGLAHYDSAVAASNKLGTGYVDAGGTFQPIHNANGLTLYSTFVVTLEIDWAILNSDTAHATHGWDSDHEVYTEGGIGYSLDDIQASLDDDVMKIYVKPATDSRIRFFASAATDDLDFNDMTKKTEGIVSAGQVDNIDDSNTKGYAYVGNATLTDFDATEYGANSKTASVTSTFNYYVLGKKGNSDNNEDDTAVGGPIAVKAFLNA